MRIFIGWLICSRPRHITFDSTSFQQDIRSRSPLRICQHMVSNLQYGEDAIKEGMGNSGGGGGGMGDIFDILSGGGGRRQQPRERRGENVVHRLKASLEEMYSGAVRKLSLSRNIKCDTCAGSGTKSGKRYQCDVGYQPDIILSS